jgi:hypothetical protein
MEEKNTEECDHEAFELVTTGRAVAGCYEDWYTCVDCGKDVYQEFRACGFKNEDGTDFDINGAELV